MRNTVLALMIAGGHLLTGCKSSPAVEQNGLEKGYSMVNDSMVKLVEADPIVQDAFNDRFSVFNSQAEMKMATLYFKINRDSSVRIANGGNEAMDIKIPILYKDMEKTTQDKFAELWNTPKRIKKPIA